MKYICLNSINIINVSNYPKWMCPKNPANRTKSSTKPPMSTSTPDPKISSPSSINPSKVATTMTLSKPSPENPSKHKTSKAPQYKPTSDTTTNANPTKPKSKTTINVTNRNSWDPATGAPTSRYEHWLIIEVNSTGKDKFAQSVYPEDKIRQYAQELRRLLQAAPQLLLPTLRSKRVQSTQTKGEHGCGREKLRDWVGKVTL